MILCPRCFKKINKELHEVGDGFTCPNCRQIFSNENAVPTLKFPDCVSSIRYVGLNSIEDANFLLKMMQ